MLKEHQSLISYINKAIDIVLTIASFFLAFTICESLEPRFHIYAGLDSIESYSWMIVVIIPAWIFSLGTSKIYDTQRTSGIHTYIFQLTKALFLAALICAASVFLFRMNSFSRSLFFTFIGVNYFLLISWKLLVRQVLHTIRKKGYNFREVLIIGDEQRTSSIREIILQNRAWGLHVLGVIAVNKDEDPTGATGDSQSVEEILSTLKDILTNYVVDEVLVSMPKTNFPSVEKIVHLCEEMGITVRIVLDFFDLKIYNTAVTQLEDTQFLTLHAINLDADKAFIKRTMDVVLSAFGLLMTGIFCIPISIGIKLSSNGPIFFRQTRVGQNGRLFTLYKFRTMVHNAEFQKGELLKENEMNHVMFKMENDPRLTPFGKLLRKFSIDEFPQLFNILRGDMSFVGPRPPLPEEVAQYSTRQRRRLSIKTGLTGLWQISGRSNIQDFNSVVKQDLDYIDQWSLWLDLKIIMKTIWVVAAQKGAK